MRGKAEIVADPTGIHRAGIPDIRGISGRYFGSAGVSGEQMREQESVWKINLNSN